MLLLAAGIREAQVNELHFVVFDELNYVCSRLCHSYLLIEKGVSPRLHHGATTCSTSKHEACQPTVMSKCPMLRWKALAFASTIDLHHMRALQRDRTDLVHNARRCTIAAQDTPNQVGATLFLF
ncbi:hypothetical protein [Massilia consociata]|uniref:hypothetical protein n=1 Tax=Massilia consociata TaxID=760117 RepID=UPI0036D26512